MACAVNVRTLAWVRDALDAAGELVRAGLRDRASAAWSGAIVDSRVETAGRLFFAVAGERTDGHAFAAGAFATGSPAVVVSDAAVLPALDAAGAPYLLVRDTRRALTALARAYRAGLDARVVAITGSGGKTTTKEYVRAVLRTRYRVHANPGNLNSLVGVPLTVLDADENCEYLVCEVGANRLGEIDALGDLLHPDVAVITNIGDAHVGYFGSRDAIAREKGALLRHIAAGGRAVLPRDDDYFDTLNSMVQGRAFSFGRSAGADYRLSNVGFADGRLVFTVNGVELRLPALGEYNAMNACAAFAVGEACGIDVARMREAFASARPMPGRGRIHEAGGVTLIDESYNASPASVRKSLAMLASLPATRRIAVLGEMRELGEHADALHRAVAAEAATCGVDRLYWLGPQGETVRDAARGARADFPVELHAQMQVLVEALARELRAGDVVLIKASRACRLDEVVAALVERLGVRG